MRYGVAMALDQIVYLGGGGGGGGKPPNPRGSASQKSLFPNYAFCFFFWKKKSTAGQLVLHNFFI
jgi:hypothetical protein